jgi:hypothetical protein
VSDKEPPPQGHRREKSPKTRELPLAQQRYAEWVKAQRQPTMNDKGELPPDPTENVRDEPREPGSKLATQAGRPSKRHVAALEGGCRAHG